MNLFGALPDEGAVNQKEKPQRCGPVAAARSEETKATALFRLFPVSQTQLPWTSAGASSLNDIDKAVAPLGVVLMDRKEARLLRVAAAKELRNK